MAVSDGQAVNETVTNAAFVSRTTDSNTTGKVDLDNTDAASGSSVTNTQREINSLNSFTGRISGSAKDVKPAWLDNSVGTSTDTTKDRADALTTAVDGKITAPGSSTDEAIVRYNGTTGKVVQDSGVTIDDSNNVIIPGNLTVNGTTTTVNSTTLDVTDPNITVNDGGNQATADDTAGITVEMSDATDTKIIYDKDATSRFRCGDAGSELEIATISGTQVITNKDIDGQTASNTSRITLPKDTSTNLDLLTDKEGTLAYDTTVSKPVFNDGSSWNPIGSGAGGGGGAGFNYFNDSAALSQNPDIETDTTGYNTYADAAGATPVDGTGGSPTITIARTTAAGEVGRQTGSLELTKDAANRQGEGFNWGPEASEKFTLYDADAGKELTVSFQYRTDASYDSDEIEVFLYDVTNSNVITVNATPENDGKLKETNTSWREFKGRAYTATSTDELRVIFHIAGTSATAYNVQFDDFFCGPSTFFNVPIVEDSVTFTPTWNNLTVGNGTEEWIYQRVGDLLHIHGSILFGSTTSVSGAVTMDNPISGTTISQVNGANSRVNGSVYYRDFDSSANRELGGIEMNGVNEIALRSLNGSQVNATVPFTWTTSDSISFDAWFRVDEWDAGALLSSTQANDLTIRATATYTGGSHTSTGSWQTVAGTETIEEDTHSALSAGVFTAPRDGTYIVTGSVAFNVNTTGQRGVRIEGGLINGELRDAASANGDIVNVCSARKLDAGDTLTFEAFQNSGGNLAYSTTTLFSVQSLPDFTHFGVFGELQFEAATSSAFALNTGGYSSGEYAQMTGNSVTLTPGQWVLNGQFRITDGTATAITDCLIFWATVNGDNTTTVPTLLTVDAGNTETRYNDGSSKLDEIRPLGTVRTTISETTTVYVVPRVTFSTAGSGTIQTVIYAERLA